MLKAPISKPGVVLSQPPISTAPSTGWLRSNSSASMANRLRYIMVVGLTKLSDSEIAGSSNGKPPACRMPRFTSSTRCLKWVWQVLVSLQVFRIAMMGLPDQSTWS